MVCTVLVEQLNIIFGLITQIIKSLHGLHCMVLKDMCFGCDTKSNIYQGLYGGMNKIYLLSYPIMRWVNLMQA